ncbi:hypothetical protein F4561_006284 [Lipingzhangella halophila]|uniref:Uncharacterized protein n=1 Tax=Lipingzhangella halophila TaxID=1783352 RepID=A0A7W7RNR1_9ACTN|nr:hypothetical protein [Lipingzhangella halophila]MBB4935390.1 hypothetical protein [Lipingzhangella halophila]
MARTTNGQTQQARQAAPQRRPRPSARRRAPLDTNLPQPRRSLESEQETAAPARPMLRWVLVTDENGRTRPEARWHV